MRRLTTGGRIDRTRPLTFSFDGRPRRGFQGDTLASALLGAGVDVIGTSVTLGRPRGIMSAGMEEPTGFAQVTSGGVTEPLVRMTGLALYQGLTAQGQGRIARGYLSDVPDEGRFDKRYAHCDVLVVGAGPAGLAAALVASCSGARVVVVERDTVLGGALLHNSDRMAGGTCADWAEATTAALGAAPETRVLTAATAALLMDQNGVIVAQHLGAMRPVSDRAGLPEQRLWHIRARTIVLATGAHERPIVFQDNDRPGIMLAAAARAYLHRYAVAPTQGLVFTTGDDAYRTALDWHAAGVGVAGVIDARTSSDGDLPRLAAAAGIPLHWSSVVEGTHADAVGRLQSVRVRTPAGRRDIAADLLAVSGGYDPALNLHLQLKGSTRYDETLGAAVPDTPLPNQYIAGAAAGTMALDDCLADGARAANDALRACGMTPDDWVRPDVSQVAEGTRHQLWRVPAPDGDESRSFVDLHRDATVAGVVRAVSAGARHIEHIKRYTLVGTGVEQGRTARTNAGAITAALTDRPLSDVGLSGSRPPVEPLSFHLLGGRARGPLFEPVRTTAMHADHLADGAVFEPAGSWLRPSRYPKPGETRQATIQRECLAARTGVAIMDASTLGKIDVRGPDAVWFLEQLYVNAIGSIPVGRARYSLMCHLDGSVLDDGVVMRTGEHQFFVTTSTGHAAAVVDWMEEWLQTEWPSRRVWVTPITEQLSTVAIVGPRSRDAIAQLAPALDLSPTAFPFLAVRRGTVAGVADAQVARVSFSGELAFEVSVPWHRGPEIWNAMRSSGIPGVTPYGLDALQVLRMEKGYIIVGQDTEALTTPHDAGLGWMVSRQKSFVGQRSLERPFLRRDDRMQLVGFVTDDPSVVVPEGAGFVKMAGAPPLRIEGHVTSSCWSPSLSRSLGLALVRGARQRHGERLVAPIGDQNVSVVLVDPVHYDRAGGRRDG